MADAQFEEFLDLTYRVVDAEENWYDLLAELAKAAQADNAAILLQDLKSGDSRGYIWGVEEKAQRAYFNYYGALNPWMPGSEVKAPDGFITGEAFLPLSKVLRTEFYTDWGRANDVVHSAGATLELRSSKFLYLAFSRKQVHGGFSDASLQPIQRILPHLKRALLLNDQLDKMRAAEAASIHRAAVVLLDQDCRVTDSNRAGEQLLRDLPICMRRDGRDRLVVTDKYGRDQLEPQLRTVLGAGRCRDTVFSAPCEPGVLIFHLQRVEVSQSAVRLRRPVARLAVVASEPETSGMELVRRLFGLTPAETQLASELLHLGALDLLLKVRAETNRRVSRETAKTHLESLFRKTETRRQGELIRKLTYLTTVLTAEPQQRS